MEITFLKIIAVLELNENMKLVNVRVSSTFIIFMFRFENLIAFDRF